MITAASTLRRSDRDPPLANLAEIIKPDAPLRRFKPYPEYKDSGVEWLREIPAHWEAVKLSGPAGSRMAMHLQPIPAKMETWVQRPSGLS